jgi:GT2 family glycosyltransferase
MSDVTVGIVAYRRPGPLARLLDTLSALPVEIVVANVGGDADVSSVCGLRAEVRELRVANRGYAAAVNAIVASSITEIVVFTNDDVEPDGDAVGVLADVVRRGEADVAVPTVLEPSGEDAGSVLALPTVGRLLVEWAILPDNPPSSGRSHGIEKWRRPESTQRVDAATAVMIAARRSTLLAHPLPNCYFLYWEELEWFWQLRDAGVRVVVAPASRVVHDGGRADIRPEKSRLLARNAVRCVRRTQGRVAAIGAVLVVTLWNLRLVGTDIVRLAAAPSALQRRRVAARWAGLLTALTSWGEVR